MGILFSRRTDSSRTRYRSHTDSGSGFDYDDDERCTRVNRQPNNNNTNNNSKINKRVNRVTQQRRILSLPSFSFFTSRSRTNNNHTSPRFFDVGGGVNNTSGQPNTSPRSGRTGLFKKQYLIDNHYVYHQQSPLFSNEGDLIEAYDGNNHENHDYRHLSSSSTMTATTDRDSTVMTQRESFSSSLVPETMHLSSSAAAASSPHSSSSSLLLSSSGNDDHDKRESSVIDANILRILGEEQKQLFHSNNSGDAASTKQHSSSFMRPVSNSFILSHQPCLSPRRPNKPAPPLPLYARVQNYSHKTDIS